MTGRMRKIPDVIIITPKILVAIDKLLDKTGAVYSDDIQKEIPEYSRNTITSWLRLNGYARPFGQNSKRWVKKNICY
jgi:hypothetical protein